MFSSLPFLDLRRNIVHGFDSLTSRNPKGEMFLLENETLWIKKKKKKLYLRRSRNRNSRVFFSNNQLSWKENKLLGGIFPGLSRTSWDEIEFGTSLINLVTHQAQTLAFKRIFVLFLKQPSVVTLFFGVYVYQRTDTMCEINDHLFDRGLVGQKDFNRGRGRYCHTSMPPWSILAGLLIHNCDLWWSKGTQCVKRRTFSSQTFCCFSFRNVEI